MGNFKFEWKTSELSKRVLLIARVNDTSKISIMPKYLKEYVTEFNYLFHQLYKCSVIEVIDDSNYITFIILETMLENF